MSKPIIGVSPSFSDDGDYKLYSNYLTLIMRAGGTAVILPYDFTDYGMLSGAVLSGGGDVAGKYGGYEDTDILFGVTPARDEFEFRLFHALYERRVPVLGICRGHQVMNCALGGTLIRDIPEAGYKEVHTGRRTGDFHPVTAEKGSQCCDFFSSEFTVWSTHHQAVLKPGEGFKVTARSPEGIIEAIEHESGLYVGLQTHPERMDAIAPFKWLVDKAIS